QQGSQGYPRQQQYPQPQGYQTGQGAQGEQAQGWWGGQQPGGPRGQGACGGPGEWYAPGGRPQPPRKRPKWLIPAGAAAAVVGIVGVVVPGLGGGCLSQNTC